jgi:hypothetical protein
MFPQSHQEIARGHHADLLREATQERLGRTAQSRKTAKPARLQAAALRWAIAAARKAVTGRAAVHPA